MKRRCLALAFLLLPGPAFAAARPIEEGTARYQQGKALEAAHRPAEAHAAYMAALAAFKAAHETALCAYMGQHLGTMELAANAFDQAFATYTQALAWAREAGLSETEAESHMGLATITLSWGHYGEALGHANEALAIMRARHQDAFVPVILASLSELHEACGQLDKARQDAEEAMGLFGRLGDQHGVATMLQRVADLEERKDDHEASYGHYSQALSLFEAQGDQAAAARVRLALSQRARHLGDLREALSEALETRRHLPGDTVLMRKLARLYTDLDQPRQARELLADATRRDHAAGDTLGETADWGQVAEVALARRELPRAIAAYDKAIALARSLKSEVLLAFFLDRKARALAMLDRLDPALASCREAIAVLERIQRTMHGTDRRDLLADHIGYYRDLVGLLGRKHQLDGLLQAAEAARAVMLAEALHASRPPTAAAVRAALPADTALLSVTPSANRQGACVALTREQALLKLVDWSRDGEEDLGATVDTYRAMIARPDGGDPAKARALAHALYDRLIAPVAPALAGKTRLVVVPNGALGLLPFETLLLPDGHYLAERYTVAYAPSLAVRDVLSRRAYPPDRKPLLAFGGASYPTLPPAPAAADPGDAARRLAPEVDGLIARGGSLRFAYQALGHAAWPPLPGTLAEVQGIAAAVPGARLITGADVSKRRVRDLDASGELGSYRVLHFATHGLVVPELPELTSLVLSQLPDPPADDDGYLRCDEIARLHLHADLVVLSACQSGLGKLYAGEGVVGLTQAFLVAGANSLLPSLWSVADDSTARFMAAVYATAAQDQVGYAEAVARVKRRFIAGGFGEAYRRPFFWAPFVYYGP